MRLQQTRTDAEGDDSPHLALNVRIGTARLDVYGLIAAGISVAIIATVQALGGNLNTVFATVQTALTPAG